MDDHNKLTFRGSDVNHFTVIFEDIDFLEIVKRL